MKKKTGAGFSLSGSLAFFWAMTLALGLSTGSAFAKTVYWANHSGKDNRWSSSANWTGNTVPRDSDIVIFGTADDTALANCILDTDACIGKIRFHKSFSSAFDMTGHRLCITGDTADFRPVMLYSKTGKGAIIFAGSKPQVFYPGGASCHFPSVIIRCDAGGAVRCVESGIFADTLDIQSGALYCGTNNSHRFVAIRGSGGTLDFGSSRISAAGERVDLDEIDSLAAHTGTLECIGAFPQTVSLPDSAIIGKLVQNGRGGSVVAPASGSALFIDTIEILSGVFSFSDSLSVTADVVTGVRGGLILPVSASLVVRSGLDISRLDSAQIKGTLVFAGKKGSVLFAPKAGAAIGSMDLVSGKLQVAGGFQAKAIHLGKAAQPCTLSLGRGALHTVNACTVEKGAVINFESSTLRFSGSLLDFSDAGAVVPQTGSLEFIGTAPQTFIPRAGQTHPAIIQNGSGGTKLSRNSLMAGNLVIASGAFDLGGLSATVDSLRGNGSAPGDTLKFGVSDTSIVRTKGAVALDELTIQGTVRISFAGTRQDFRPNPAVSYKKIVQENTTATRVLCAKNTSVSVDKLVIRSGALDCGACFPFRVAVAVRRIVASGGAIVFGNSTILYTGDTADLSRLAVSSQPADTGGVIFTGENPQLFIPNPASLYPAVVQNAPAGLLLQGGGLSCRRFILLSGTLHCGTGLSHTVTTVFRVQGGGLDFGSSTLRLGADTVDLSRAGALVPAVGTLSFCGESGTQIFLAKPSALHPNITKINNGTLMLSGALLAKKFWISGGTFDMRGNKCELEGFSAAGGALRIGSDSIIVTGNAQFSELSALSDSDGTIVVRAAGASPVAYFSSVKHRIDRLVLSARPAASRSAKIIAGPGTHRARHLTFQWDRCGDSAVFDFRQNAAAMAVADSAEVMPAGNGADKGCIYMGGAAWTFGGDFALSNYASDASTVVFRGNTRTQTVSAPLPLADVLLDNAGTLRLASNVACRNFTLSAGALDFNRHALTADNDFTVATVSGRFLASPQPWKVSCGKNALMSGSLERPLIVGGTACTLDVAGSLIARYAVIKNCHAVTKKGVAYNSTDSSQNTNWTFSNKPLAPQNASARRANGRVFLSWNKNNDQDFLRYVIFGGTSPDRLIRLDSSLAASDTVRTVTGLINGKTYRFRISVLDSAGYESDFSEEVSATPDSSALWIKENMISFGKTAVGKTGDTVIRIDNNRGDTLYLTSALLHGRAFGHGKDTVKILPNHAFCDTLSFSPKTIGPDSAIIVYAGIAGQGPDTVRLLGIGGSAHLQLKSDTVAFGTVETSAPVVRLIARKNTGNDTLKMTQVSLEGESGIFTDSTLVFPSFRDLAPGDSCVDTLLFRPKRPGSGALFVLLKSNCITSEDTLVVTAATALFSSGAGMSDTPKDFFFGEAGTSGRSVVFKYSLPTASRVTIEVYNAIGQAIERPLETVQKADDYLFTWDATNLSRGIYFCRFRATGQGGADNNCVKTIRVVFSQ
jgi:hypothetical protein